MEVSSSTSQTSEKLVEVSGAGESRKRLWSRIRSNLGETEIGKHLRGTSVVVPALLTVSEVAAMLRTSRKAIYAMVERQQLPGVVRIGRRVLVREDALLNWLGQKSTPSLER